MAGVDLWRLPATQVVALLREKKVTPTQLIDVAEKRIKEVDSSLNAIPTLCLDRARQHATALEKEGYPSNPGPGYLYGLPVVVKDLTALKDVLYTEGSLIYKDRIADFSDPMVQNLEANGAIVIGKTNTPEFGAGSNTFNDVFGKTRNPYDTRLSCGGSSGGSAVALTCGMAWLASGTDLGGSLRIPGSFNNLVGFRGSQGLVPQTYRGRDPATYVPDPLSLKSVNGGMGRTVEDLALFLDAAAGQHPLDPTSIPKPEQPFQTAVLPKNFVPPRRVAFSEDLGGICKVQPAVAQACREAVQWFATAVGTEVVQAAPDVHDAAHLFQVLRADAFKQTYSWMLQEPARSLIKPELVWQIEKGVRQSAEEVAAAKAGHAAYVDRLFAFLGEHELLLIPTCMVAPFDVDIRWVAEPVPGVKYETYVDWLLMTSAISLAPVPALSLPVGFLPSGLPVGLQIVGPVGSDARILAVAAAFERAHSYAKDLPIDPNVTHSES